MLRILASMAGATCALALTLLGLAYLWAGSFCGNQLVQRVAAPGGRHTAFLFERDCGATTGFSTQVSIYPRGADTRLPNEAGNIFVAEEKGKGPKGYWHGPLVRMRWLDETHLEIGYHRFATIYQRAERKGIIRVNYREE